MAGGALRRAAVMGAIAALLGACVAWAASCATMDRLGEAEPAYGPLQLVTCAGDEALRCCVYAVRVPHAGGPRRLETLCAVRCDTAEAWSWVACPDDADTAEETGGLDL